MRIPVLPPSAPLFLAGLMVSGFVHAVCRALLSDQVHHRQHHSYDAPIVSSTSSVSRKAEKMRRSRGTGCVDPTPAKVLGAVSV